MTFQTGTHSNDALRQHRGGSGSTLRLRQISGRRTSFATGFGGAGSTSRFEFGYIKSPASSSRRGRQLWTCPGLQPRRLRP